MSVMELSGGADTRPSTRLRPVGMACACVPRSTSSPIRASWRPSMIRSSAFISATIHLYSWIRNDRTSRRGRVTVRATDHQEAPMSLHGLLSVTIGVPNVEETAAYYADFGLAPQAGGWFSTRDAGRQLRLVPAPTRRLIELRVGVDDADDLARAAANLTRLGLAPALAEGGLEGTEPGTGVRVGLDVAPRTRQDPVPATAYNGPGRFERQGSRA